MRKLNRPRSSPGGHSSRKFKPREKRSQRNTGCNQACGAAVASAYLSALISVRRLTMCPHFGHW